MKFLILNDTHDKGKNSINRIGDMHSDMMIKLDETIELSKDCEFVIHLGDIWDTPNVSNNVIDDWLDKIEKSGKSWYILPGNHDMIGANWENSKSSALSHAFRRCKNIQFLEELDFPTAKTFIKGYPYFYNCEEHMRDNGLKHNRKDYYTIACTHSFITEKKFPFATHIKMGDLDTNYDLVLCSHFHTVFDKTVNNTRFINNGAWGRLSITEAKHEPRVSKFNMKTREIEVIKLKSAKKAEEVFNLEKIEEIKAFDEDMMMFIKSLESVEFQSANIENIIKEVAKEKKVDKEVVDLVLNKLEAVNES